LFPETAREESDAMPTLVLSVSGARGIVGDGLDEGVAYRLARAFASVAGGGPILLGRDPRPSGPALARAAAAGLLDGGCGVCDLGIVTTPTVQVAVELGEAWGGIIITASHNPVEWNALKFVGSDGTFLGPEPMGQLLSAFRAAGAATPPVEASDLAIGREGRTLKGQEATRRHVELILAAVDAPAIRAARLAVAVDAVRGAGSVLLAPLLEALGARVVWIDREPDGQLPPHPEPRAERLGPLHALVRAEGASLGFALDPDSDRCALVIPDRILGEEWTLPLCALERLAGGLRGPLVTNLSTSSRLEEVAARYDVPVLRFPVGEAHVVGGMRAAGAVLGGEGNGGVIDPSVHLGRDAGVAAALLMELEVRDGDGGGVARAARGFAPREMVKRKIDLAPERRAALMEALRAQFGPPANEQDGLRWTRGPAWLHVRPSGTEPILRAIAEAPTADEAGELVAGVEARAAELGGRL
jgi:phosphomannomutase